MVPYTSLNLHTTKTVGKAQVMHQEVQKAACEAMRYFQTCYIQTTSDAQVT